MDDIKLFEEKMRGSVISFGSGNFSITNDEEIEDKLNLLEIKNKVIGEENKNICIKLNLSSNAHVKVAYLLWSICEEDGMKIVCDNIKKTSVNLIDSLEKAIEINGCEEDVLTLKNQRKAGNCIYTFIKDITEVVTQSGNGIYDIEFDDYNDIYDWKMIIVYEDKDENLKDIKIYVKGKKIKKIVLNEFGIQSKSNHLCVITQNVDKTLANRGDFLNYTICIENSGGIMLANAILINPIPVGTEFVENSVTVNGIAMPKVNPQIPGILLGNVCTKQTITVTFSVSIIMSKGIIENLPQLVFNNDEKYDDDSIVFGVENFVNIDDNVNF